MIEITIRLELGTDPTIHSRGTGCGHPDFPDRPAACREEEMAMAKTIITFAHWLMDATYGKPKNESSYERAVPLKRGGQE